MNINNYKRLIVSLPVKEQCVTTKRSTWTKAEREIRWLKNMNDILFNESNFLQLSRQDIFNTIKAEEKIIKIIYWGYPAGMRGNHFVSILKEIDKIKESLLNLKNKSNNTTKEFKELKSLFKKIKGLGLSTYSKLLYFFEISFNDSPCIILDNRIIDVFAKNIYINFYEFRSIKYENAQNHYIDYLSLLKQIANELETREENIELFLFSFGSNLKSS